MRTITIAELRALNVTSWPVLDGSPRGFSFRYIGEIKPGDKVIVNNHDTLVTYSTEKESRA